MRRALLLFIVLAACSGTGEDDGPPPPPPPTPCLFTAEPSAVSFELDGNADTDVTCTLLRIDTNDAETVLVFAPCTGTAESATVAIGSVPALPIDVTVGETLDLSFEQSIWTRRIAIRRAGDLVLAGSTGAGLDEAGFLEPLRFSSRSAGCDPIPQMCSLAAYASEPVILDFEGIGAPMAVASRHAFDDGPRHVRVEQADHFSGDLSQCIDIPGVWFDFVVTLDRS